MTLTEAKKRVKFIEEVQCDCEAAHGYEDQLYLDFIEDVATNINNGDIAEIAKEILKTKQLEFARWCA